MRHLQPPHVAHFESSICSQLQFEDKEFRFSVPLLQAGSAPLRTSRRLTGNYPRQSGHIDTEESALPEAIPRGCLTKPLDYSQVTRKPEVVKLSREACKVESELILQAFLASHSQRMFCSPPCLENPRPEGAESTLTENAPSPFHAEPEQHCMLPDPNRTRLFLLPLDGVHFRFNLLALGLRQIPHGGLNGLVAHQLLNGLRSMPDCSSFVQ
jgi:hypothetical protein